MLQCLAYNMLKKNKILNAKTWMSDLSVIFTRRMKTTLRKSKLYSRGKQKKDVCVTQVKQNLKRQNNHHRIQRLPVDSASLSAPEKWPRSCCSRTENDRRRGAGLSNPALSRAANLFFHLHRRQAFQVWFHLKN